MNQTEIEQSVEKRTENMERSTERGSAFPVLGILGGGQLARMTAYEAFRLGIRVHIMEQNAGSPAGSIAHHEVVGTPSDHALLRQFAEGCDVVTLESEFVNEDDLAEIERSGSLLYPSSRSVGQIQDKLVQKETLQSAGIAVAPFAPVESVEECAAFAEEHGYPVVLKSRRGGYDGYGNATIRSAGEIEEGMKTITQGELRNDLYVEAFVPFVKELAVMVARGRDGEVVTYPVVETVQKNHICHTVVAPATVSDSERETTLDLARRAIEAIEGIGIFGVELFLSDDGTLLVNELAPRPHNSGHYTIEGCVTSQFENHIRAVMGWPLGSTELRAPGVAMVNILGRGEESGAIDNYAEILADRNAHLHIYGKERSRTGRKMGHVTLLADSVEEAVARAVQVEQIVRFRSR